MEATRKGASKLAGWRRVRAGWYRRRVPDGGLWVHIVHRTTGWAIAANQDEWVVDRWSPLRFGFETLADARDAADRHWFRGARNTNNTKESKP